MKRDAKIKVDMSVPNPRLSLEWGSYMTDALTTWVKYMGEAELVSSGNVPFQPWKRLLQGLECLLYDWDRKHEDCFQGSHLHRYCGYDNVFEMKLKAMMNWPPVAASARACAPTRPASLRGTRTSVRVVNVHTVALFVWWYCDTVTVGGRNVRLPCWVGKRKTLGTVHIQGDRRLIEKCKRVEKIELLTAKMLNTLVFTVLKQNGQIWATAFGDADDVPSLSISMVCWQKLNSFVVVSLATAALHNYQTSGRLFIMKLGAKESSFHLSCKICRSV